jgi:hypothetical protein
MGHFEGPRFGKSPDFPRNLLQFPQVLRTLVMMACAPCVVALRSGFWAAFNPGSPDGYGLVPSGMFLCLTISFFVD